MRSGLAREHVMRGVHHYTGANTTKYRELLRMGFSDLVNKDI